MISGATDRSSRRAPGRTSPETMKAAIDARRFIHDSHPAAEASANPTIQSSARESASRVDQALMSSPQKRASNRHAVASGGLCAAPLTRRRSLLSITLRKITRICISASSRLVRFFFKSLGQNNEKRS